MIETGPALLLNERVKSNMYFLEPSNVLFMLDSFFKYFHLHL